MSIYATLWKLKFPRDGDDYLGCEWISVTAQGVPPHIGSPTPGCGYENGDPFAAFLPPPIHTDEHGEAEYMRAVVFVTENTSKGTARSPHQTEEAQRDILPLRHRTMGCERLWKGFLTREVLDVESTDWHISGGFRYY
jgi:hypothetical protein